MPMTDRGRKRPTLTLIIPAYNETTRLLGGLYHVLTYLSAARFPWELIIVDDGSAIPVARVLREAKASKLLHTAFSKHPICVYRL